MKPILSGLFLAGFFAMGAHALAKSPLALLTENPHYFLFRGQPTVLITSGEHYGAVLNLDFNYQTYLATLQKDHLNLTRVFTGAYVEPAGAFGIAQNTLAPAPLRFLCPWARGAVPGYAGGGNKFDLTRWDPAYFNRLKDFIATAGRCGVVVELNLFCPFYDESQWKVSPQNPSNNVNGLGQVERTNVYTLDHHGGLLAVQEAMVRKLVTELRGFDNLYYEICNEPYFGGVTPEWQDHIADVIADAEKKGSRKHLISRNIANGKAKVFNPHPGVSIFNFHYATPPETVPMNYGLNKVIGDNETGFKGTQDAVYRMEGWEFMLAGGGLFNNLDYSFTVGHEQGDFLCPTNQPGGGSPALRKQLGYLADFMGSLNLANLKPNNMAIRGGVPPGAVARALVEPGQAWAIYVNGGSQAKLKLDLPSGQFKVEWLNPRTGKIDQAETLNHGSGWATVSSPSYTEDIALRIKRVKTESPITKPPPAPRNPRSKALNLSPKSR